MTKKPTRQRQPWTPQDLAKLRNLAGGNTPTRLIADKLDRTEAAIRAKASNEGISLKPTNQSPYTRRKK